MIFETESLRGNPLWEYFQSHAEGKGIWKWRHYFEIYHRHLSRFVGSELRLVEVGVYSGGSIEMWGRYFGERCHVHGVDIEKRCEVYQGDQVTIHIGDQADRSFWREFKEKVPPIDILIDDGGHLPDQQIVTLEEMLPQIRPGGVYLCEDVLGDDQRFWNYVSGLITQLNTYNMKDAGKLSAEPTPFQRAIQSIHVYPFVVVIEKRREALDEFCAPRRGSEWQPFL